MKIKSLIFLNSIIFLLNALFGLTFSILLTKYGQNKGLERIILGDWVYSFFISLFIELPLCFLFSYFIFKFSKDRFQLTLLCFSLAICIYFNYYVVIQNFNDFKSDLKFFLHPSMGSFLRNILFSIIICIIVYFTPAWRRVFDHHP